MENFPLLEKIQHHYLMDCSLGFSKVKSIRVQWPSRVPLKREIGFFPGVALPAFLPEEVCTTGRSIGAKT